MSATAPLKAADKIAPQKHLTFSPKRLQKMNRNISKTLYTTLIDLGVPPEKIGAFDHHSSIELKFKIINPIIITTNNNMVWIWTELKDLNSVNVNFHAANLLDALQYALPGVLTGQAVLGKANDCYEIKALLADECVESPDKLHRALDEFYSLIMSIHNILNH
jgi:hypothetical protein